MGIKDIIKTINEFIEKEKSIKNYLDEDFVLDFPENIFNQDVTVEYIRSEDIVQYNHYDKQDIIFKITYKEEIRYTKMNLVNAVDDEFHLSDLRVPYDKIRLAERVGYITLPLYKEIQKEDDKNEKN